MAKEKQNKPNSGLYVAVFFVLVILILIMFFVKKDNIVSNLKKTNFFERIGMSTPEFVENHKETETENNPIQEDFEIDLMGTEDESENNNNQNESIENNIQVPEETKKTEIEESSKTENSSKNAQTKKETEKSEKTKTVEKSVSEKSSATQKSATKSASATRTATLYFVSIGSDGSVNRASVKRQLPKSDSPLTDAIKALLSGPVPGEKNVMSLIPSGSKLIGASVKNGVATLNFNENFEFNTYGVEGSIGQLMQIVYTATEFSTVQSVQFLIEGEKKDYLGSEGQWIGSPLSRSSF